jgi:hypothetical protein
MRRMGIRDRPTRGEASRSGVQHMGFARVTALRSVLIFGERHLRRVLTLSRSTTTKPPRTWDWPRTHRYDAPSNDAETFSQRLFCPDCIIATPGYDFQEGQLSSSRAWFIDSSVERWQHNKHDDCIKSCPKKDNSVADENCTQHNTADNDTHVEILWKYRN